MMKTVYLIRHGKSDWKAGLADFERPLNKRGINDTVIMAKAISALDHKPQLFFYSSAKRTEQTTLLLTEHLQLDKLQRIKCPELYLCQPEAIFDIIHFAPDHIDSIAIVGHNPAMTETAAILSEDHSLYLPTLGIQVLTFDTTNWDETNSNTRIKSIFMSPKQAR